MNCKPTTDDDQFGDWENIVPEDDKVSYTYDRKRGIKMEKILMHPIISRAVANMTRTPKEEKERAMAGVRHLVNTRRHITESHQAARNAVEELECGLLGDYDAGGIVKIPEIRQKWIQKRIREAIDLGLPQALREACYSYLELTGSPYHPFQRRPRRKKSGGRWRP